LEQVANTGKSRGDGNAKSWSDSARVSLQASFPRCNPIIDFVYAGVTPILGNLLDRVTFAAFKQYNELDSALKP
jgi:hypothetical protein